MRAGIASSAKQFLTAAFVMPAVLYMPKINSSSALQWLGKTPVVPEFKAPATRAAWELERLDIRVKLWRLLGRMPARPELPAVKTLSREDRGAYWLEKFKFDNGAGATVPGVMLLPKKSGRHSAILYCHQHGDLGAKGGKQELFQTNPVPVAPGPELVKRGYVVIAIDAYGFGERAARGPGKAAEQGGAEELSAAKFNLWFGRTLWGMILRDDLMALDYLFTRKEVDVARVGVTGFSMGATRAWWLLALDERLKAGVPVACLTRYQNLIRSEALAAHGIYYFVPGMLEYFDTESVVALIAPRPVLFQTGDADAGSPADGVREIESRVKPVYRLFSAEKNFQSLLVPALGHKYLPEMWARTLKWLERNLKRAR